jgi:hypothetical protein
MDIALGSVDIVPGHFFFQKVDTAMQVSEHKDSACLGQIEFFMVCDVRPSDFVGHFPSP